MSCRTRQIEHDCRICEGFQTLAVTNILSRTAAGVWKTSKGRNRGEGHVLGGAAGSAMGIWSWAGHSRGCEGRLSCGMTLQVGCEAGWVWLQLNPSYKPRFSLRDGARRICRPPGAKKTAGAVHPRGQAGGRKLQLIYFATLFAPVKEKLAEAATSP